MQRGCFLWGFSWVKWKLVAGKIEFFQPPSLEELSQRDGVPIFNARWDHVTGGPIFYTTTAAAPVQHHQPLPDDALATLSSSSFSMLCWCIFLTFIIAHWIGADLILMDKFFIVSSFLKTTFKMQYSAIYLIIFLLLDSFYWQFRQDLMTIRII